MTIVLGKGLIGGRELGVGVIEGERGIVEVEVLGVVGVTGVL